MGADRCLGTQRAVGAAFSWNEESGGGKRGKYEFDMRNVNPYIGWRTGERTSL